LSAAPVRVAGCGSGRGSGWIAGPKIAIIQIIAEKSCYADTPGGGLITFDAFTGSAMADGAVDALELE